MPLSRDQIRAYRAVLEGLRSAPPGCSAAWAFSALAELQLVPGAYREASRLLDRHADDLERLTDDRARKGLT